VLSHPPYSPDLAPAHFFYFLNENCVERDKIRSFFNDPTDCDERTEGDMGTSVSSGIQFVV
jgi:hypothetical protein